jgi:hypothetical protein
MGKDKLSEVGEKVWDQDVMEAFQVRSTNCTALCECGLCM